MRKKSLLKLTVSLVLSVFTIGCSHDFDPSHIAPSNRDGIRSKLTLDDAIRLAEEYITPLDAQTRATSRTVKNVEVIGNQSTRGSQLDSLFYIVNYDNEEGFVMVSSTDLTNPVYAVSDTGNLSEADGDSIPALKDFFESARLYAINLPNDSMVFNRGEHTHLSIEHRVLPRVSPVIRKLGQNAPYNRYCNGYPAGCMAVAMASVMSFYQWPASYIDVNNNNDLFVFDWETVNTVDQSDHTMRILKLLGNRNLLNMQYGYKGRDESVSSKSYVTPSFKKLGYQVDDNANEISLASNYTKAVNMIRGIDGYDAHVLYVDGRNMRDDESSGHAWIVDGELTYRSTTYYRPLCRICNPNIDPSIKLVNSYEIQPALLHCVWGWNGKCNGYFRYDLGSIRFDTTPQVATSENVNPTEQTWTQYGNIVFWAVKPNRQ